MLEQIYGLEPYGTSEEPSPIGGVALVQYDEMGPYVSVGITLNRDGLKQYLQETEGPDGEVPEEPIKMMIRLERAAVNRLIGTLRKARDTSFGPDV